MLRATAFPAPYNSVPVISKTHTCHSGETTRVVYSCSSFVSRFKFQQFRQLHVKSLPAFRPGATVSTARKTQGRGGAGLVGIDDDEDVIVVDDDDDDEEGEEDEDDDDDDDDDGEEEIVSFEKMEKWLEKKPKGFGEGKVYDTSIEDKLLEEMQLSKEAQITNLKKLKADVVTPASKNNAPNKKYAKVVPVRGRVRLVNLPKKKNIDRDLKLAFQGIPGITNIVPAVLGNKKTRDPICKGFAFVDFKHEEDAVRFVELYTEQTITFGKIQKQIKCELLNAQSSSSLELSKNISKALPLLPSIIEEDSNDDSNMYNSALSSWDETVLDDSDEQQGSDRENEESPAALKVGYHDSIEMRVESEINSLPSEQVDRNPTDKQESSAKVRQKSAPKKKPSSNTNVKKVLDIPGSSKRLKVREKAVLNDVFSKYGSKGTLASKTKV